ncbi:MAG: hypothetical protein QXX30_02455 [Candidatus Aenigmatarchaeota archaeon]
MREEIFFIDISYEIDNNKGIILLFGKNREGKRVLVKKEFYNYFFVLPTEGKEEEVYNKIRELKNLPTRILFLDYVEKKIENL